MLHLSLHKRPCSESQSSRSMTILRVNLHVNSICFMILKTPHLRFRAFLLQSFFLVLGLPQASG